MRGGEGRGREAWVFPFYKFNENYDFIKEWKIVPIARNRFLIKKIAVYL